MQMQSLLRNKWFKWTNIIIIGVLFLILMSVDIKNLTSEVGWEKNTWVEGFTNPYIWIGLSTYIVFVPGIKYLLVYKNIIKHRNNMDLLIALAIHVAYLFSLIVIIVDKELNVIWEPIGLLYVFDNIGEEIQIYIKNKNDSERFGLESLKEKEVMTLSGVKKPINEIKKGDIVIFKKGDIIQLDGIVDHGEGMLDTSNINGESKPYYVKSNSNVVSGAKLISDEIHLKVINTFEDSTLNRLIILINKTNKIKPKIQTIADKIYKYMIPFVLIVTIITTIIWLLIGYLQGTTPIISNKDLYLYNSFLIAVSVLAVACPCAMTVTAPLINLVAAQSYWKSNIVFNKTQDMEKINDITDVVLDKTGTITTNDMIITQSFGDEKFHKIASALEKNVYHPISNAIYQKYHDNDVEVKAIEEIPGKGVRGKINNDNYFITKTSNDEINKIFKTKVKPGTLVGLYKNKSLISAYVLESEIKSNAYKLIEYFKTKNIIPIILSGDNEFATKLIADKLGVDYKFNQTPKDKADYIQSLQKNNRRVMMVGDGLNDSIAIKYSDVSISFASGSPISNSYSSISLLGNDLKNIIYLMEMSKKTKFNYKTAIGWAIGFNLIFIPFAASGFIYPWVAALIMYVSNLILFAIIFNFKRILNRLEWKVFGHRIVKKIDVKINKNLMTRDLHSDHCH